MNGVVVKENPDILKMKISELLKKSFWFGLCEIK